MEEILYLVIYLLKKKRFDIIYQSVANLWEPLGLSASLKVRLVRRFHSVGLQSDAESLKQNNRKHKMTTIIRSLHTLLQCFTRAKIIVVSF